MYALSAGKTESGFSKLDAFGAIHEVEGNAERLEAIANQHMAAVREGKSSLIVAPTHAECRAISQVVRDRQRREGLLSGEEHGIRRLEKVNLTESQRRDPIYYNLGHVVEFHRRARGGFKSGERREVGRCSSQNVVVVKDGQAKLLPLAQAKSFNVYTQEEVSVAVGDTLRITKNFRGGTSRFRNNELCTVTAIDRESITVGDGREIKRTGPLHLDQGVAVTSHASQGKTVDQVIVSVPVRSEGRPPEPISTLADLQVKAYENRVRERLMAKYPTRTPVEAKRLEKQIQKLVQIYAEGRSLLQSHPTGCVRQNHHPQIEQTRGIEITDERE